LAPLPATRAAKVSLYLAAVVPMLRFTETEPAQGTEFSLQTQFFAHESGGLAHFRS
jgi:hypothetical protein